MKQVGLFLVLTLAAMPSWGAKKVTVAELKDTLTTMHQANKSDAEVASVLKQLELSEELTRSTMNSLIADVPGPLSTEQIYVLEASSANLAPPPSDIPSTAVPDAAAQKAILDKATDYVSKTYSALPGLTATKTTVRFQDNTEVAPQSGGLHSGATDATVGSSFSSSHEFIHYINSTDFHVASDHGAEKFPAEKDKTPWGVNRMIALQMPDPSLGTVFPEAQTAGDMKFVRWETINGIQTAVYSFTVPKKKAHFPINVCCFPNVDQAGMVTMPSPSGISSGSSRARGNFQTNTDWSDYKANAPYHGELFIDPATGAVVRMITMADLKSSDVVHRVDERIDYGPATVGGKMLLVPLRTIIDTEVVPSGDSGLAGKYTTRRTLFTSEYKDYQPAGQ